MTSAPGIPNGFKVSLHPGHMPAPLSGMTRMPPKGVQELSGLQRPLQIHDCAVKLAECSCVAQTLGMAVHAPWQLCGALYPAAAL